MGFASDYTEEELAELTKLECILDRNMPEYNPNASQSSASGSDPNHATAPAGSAGSRQYVPVRHLFLSPSPTSSFMAPGTPEQHLVFARVLAANCRQMFRDMNLEIILRGGQNIRNTRVVTNHILSWTVTFHKASSMVACKASSEDGGTKISGEWMRSLVAYFEERMDAAFSQLNIRAQEEKCVAALSAPQVHLTDAISHCVNFARSVVTPMLISSPYFISAIRSCREMVLALKVAQGLLLQLSFTSRNANSSQMGYYFSAPPQQNSNQSRRVVFSLAGFTEDHLAPLRTDVWRFRAVLLFLGALELQQSQQQRVTSAATASASAKPTVVTTTVGTAALSEQHLDHAIHCIASIVAEIDSMRVNTAAGSSMDVRSTLDTLVLGHIKNACLSRFPPSSTVALLRNAQATGTSGGPTAATGPSLGAVVVSPLLHQLLVDYPTFIASTVRFAERNEIGDWGRCLALAQLFCWDTTTPPPDAGTQSTVRQVTYHTPRVQGVYSVKPTIMYAIVREALRPLLMALLPASTGSASAAAATAGGSAEAGGAVDGAVRVLGSAAAGSGQGGAALPLSEQRLCATLLTAVSWLKGVVFPASSRMSRWASLDVGDQTMREYSLGEACFKGITAEILEDALDEALDQVDKECSDRETAAISPAADRAVPGAPPLPIADPTARLAAAVVQYLRRVERVWNALTNHIIELDSHAFDEVLAMGAKTVPSVVGNGGGGGGAGSMRSPPPANMATSIGGSAVASAAGTAASVLSYDTGMLASCKYLFYDMVPVVMQRRWPKHYADLLTDQLLHSINVYLLRAESGTLQRSMAASAGGGGGVGAAAAAMRPSAPSPGSVKQARPAPGEVAGRPSGPLGAGAAAGPGSRPPATAAAAAALVEQETTVVLASPEEFFCALRLVRCIKNRDNFVDRYIPTVRERLLTRPAPDVIAESELEGNKRHYEREAEEFLSSWLGDGSLLKMVRELHNAYAIQTSSSKPRDGEARQAAAAELKLTTTVIDWRMLDVVVEGDGSSGGGDAAEKGTSDAVATVAPTPYTAAELVSRSGQASLMATSATAPLPFPTDVLVSLDKVEQAYTDKHTGRVLRWDWANHAYTSFTLMYPNEKGRVTTVHGTLLLQRLFLAIAAYGRSGVSLKTLAYRAGVEERRVASLLKPCLDRDRLLVRIGGTGSGAAASARSAAGTAAPASQPFQGPTARAATQGDVGGGGTEVLISLNYDYTRNPSRPRGEYTYWPGAERRTSTMPSAAELDATRTKRNTIINVSIMQVMKQRQRIQHEALYTMVREKNAKIFDVTVRNFKQEIEGLIGKGFMTRDTEDPNMYVFLA